VPSHLRVQLTLLPPEAGGRKTPGSTADFRTVLTVSGRHFGALVSPHGVLQPGGAAVHCDVALGDANDARAFFPPGTQFEVWEGGRRGYGSVLAHLDR
jgi:hypothetical protein